MPTLPANLSYGRVVGRFLSAVADTGDVGVEPDAVAATGTVRFTPGTAVARNVTTVPPVTLVLNTITCSLDSEGYMVDAAGNPGVTLIATDDADLNPSGWTYTVAVSLNGNSVNFTFDISVAAGSETDLSAVIPVQAEDGEYYLTGPRGYSAYEIAVANGFVGTESEWLASLAAGGEGGAVFTVNGQVGDVVLDAADVGAAAAADLAAHLADPTPHLGATFAGAQITGPIDGGTFT